MVFTVNQRYLDLGSAKFLQPVPEDPPGNQIVIEEGWINRDFGTPRRFFVPQTTTVGFNPVSGLAKVRWDLVVIDNNNVVQIVQGTEQNSPIAEFTGVAETPDNATALAIVQITESGTVVIDQTDVTDVRPVVTFTKTFKQLFAEPQKPAPNNRVFVNGGVIPYSNGTTTELIVDNFAVSVIFPVVTTNPRIDLLGIDISGVSPTPIRIAGVENVSPIKPDIDVSNIIPIAFVTIDETVSVVINEADIEDARTLFNSPFLTEDQLQANIGNGGFPPNLANYHASIDEVTSIVNSAFSLGHNYIGGLITRNSGADTDHDIVIGVGECKSDDNLVDMILPSEIIKQIDVVWSVGNNAGGLDIGTVAADTLYAVWLIKRSDTGVVDALFSTDFFSPTMPASYDKKRLIGAISTDSISNIIGYTQVGDYFRYSDVITDFITASLAINVFVTQTVSSCPPHCIAHVYIETTCSLQSLVGAFVKTQGSAEVASLGNRSKAWNSQSSGDSSGAGKEGTVLVDASSQIEVARSGTGGSGDIECNTFGFYMLTRREPK